MRIPVNQISAQLEKKLAPLYFISGEEPLQMKECADVVRLQAKNQGFDSREILEVGRDFDWHSLQHIGNSLSLFAEKRVIELRLPSAKPGKVGSAALLEYVAKPPQDTILLIVAGKLDKASQNSKWFKAIEQLGVIIQIWPLKVSELPQWVSRRMAVNKLKTNPMGIQLLVQRVEGNLLAAAQEIEKLALLYGNGQQVVEIDERKIADAVSDSSRFNVYDLAESALLGSVGRAVKILNGLQSEGVAPPLILWVLTNEVRTLGAFIQQKSLGKNIENVINSVWSSRKPAVRSAVQRMTVPQWSKLLNYCASVDQIAKGIKPGNTWDELLNLTLGIADFRFFKSVNYV